MGEGQGSGKQTLTECSQSLRLFVDRRPFPRRGDLSRGSLRWTGRGILPLLPLGLPDSDGVARRRFAHAVKPGEASRDARGCRLPPHCRHCGTRSPPPLPQGRRGAAGREASLRTDRIS
ncbi:hypothetical protein AAFF_G00399400 [Aldrovandia affinis]|uniref:Uncharacterized protein n=1 Tax=Aldrovandia affinis TaxID=143900 RepID=A0AAD7SCV0_9TELE|nr:hypothetical protein AAFF_G00399400 [Aldrovandia affinis]